MDPTRRNSTPPPKKKHISTVSNRTPSGEKTCPPLGKGDAVGDMLVPKRVLLPLKGETRMDCPFNQETTSRKTLER